MCFGILAQASKAIDVAALSAPEPAATRVLAKVVLKIALDFFGLCRPGLHLLERIWSSKAADATRHDDLTVGIQTAAVLCRYATHALKALTIGGDSGSTFEAVVRGRIALRRAEKVCQKRHISIIPSDRDDNR